VLLLEQQYRYVSESFFTFVAIIKLSHECAHFVNQVQVVGLLCQTEKKDSRHELLRRVAAGGGVFENDKGKVQIPGANLNDIANQADDLLEVG
jgi:hypothetical protein